MNIRRRYSAFSGASIRNLRARDSEKVRIGYFSPKGNAGGILFG
jgi:hypothetical protein